MLRTRNVIVASLLFAINAAGVGGDTLHVPQQYPTIQAAIDEAQNYDDVLVADGVYTGSGNKNLDFGGIWVTVHSENGPTQCVIDCENDGRGFYFLDYVPPAAVVEGFTIQNAYVDWVGGWADGGAIKCEPGGSPTIVDCIIIGNKVEGRGGGIYGCGGPISNCIITGNEAAAGAGLYDCDGPITGCTITGNVTTSAGGGVYKCDGPISDCDISFNTCGTGGGVGSDGGGGLFECTGSISNCTIIGNACLTIRSLGGGLNHCSGPITNCTISANWADLGGGGLGECQGTISHCEISENSAGAAGGDSSTATGRSPSAQSPTMWRFPVAECMNATGRSADV